MKKLNDLELKNIEGGISGWAIAGISIAVAFIAGILDGITRPLKCEN